MSIRVAAIADQHGFLPSIPSCDLLLIAGDVCPIESHALDYQRRWLQGPFASWLEGLDAGRIIGIAGNHEFIAEAEPGLMRELPWTYLAGETTELDGLAIHGTPWAPTFGRWAFMRGENDLIPHWEAIPDGIDILVSHGPPLGHGDLVIDGRHGGSLTLLRRLQELERLRLHVFGHIHEAGGTRSRLASAELANVSYVDFDYRPAREAAVFEL